MIECSSGALEEVESEEVRSLIKDKDDILVVFESIMFDKIMLTHHINCEEFKALTSRYHLAEDEEIKRHIEGVAGKLFEINSKYSEIE